MRRTKSSDSSAVPGSMWPKSRSSEKEPVRTRLGGSWTGCEGTRSISITTLAQIADSGGDGPGVGCATRKWTPRRFISKTACLRAYVYARQRGLLWGSLASCGRLSIGQMPRWHRTAAVANTAAQAASLPHIAPAFPLLCRAPRGKGSTTVQRVPYHHRRQRDHHYAGGPGDHVGPHPVLPIAHQPPLVHQNQHEDQHEGNQYPVGHLREQNQFQQRQPRNQHAPRAHHDQERVQPVKNRRLRKPFVNARLEPEPLAHVVRRGQRPLWAT